MEMYASLNVAAVEEDNVDIEMGKSKTARMPWHAGRDPRATFGVPSGTATVDVDVDVDVVWVDGHRERYHGLAVQRIHILVRGEGDS